MIQLNLRVPEVVKPVQAIADLKTFGGKRIIRRRRRTIEFAWCCITVGVGVVLFVDINLRTPTSMVMSGFRSTR